VAYNTHFATNNRKLIMRRVYSETLEKTLVAVTVVQSLPL
jgi:hypothetical protein